MYSFLAVGFFVTLVGGPAFWFLVMFFGFPGGCRPKHEVGTRVGTIVQLKQGGLFFNSMEGRINEGVKRVEDSDNFEPDTWDFSLEDAKLFGELQEASRNGKPVVLHYRKWWARPMSQDRRYTVTGIEAMSPE